MLPCENDKTVKPVPFVSKVGSVPNDAHGNHLYTHLNGEESKNTVVHHLEVIKECLQLDQARSKLS